MVTLHPQSAMEHLHHRFLAADGAGSDGAIAFEATEVVGHDRAAHAGAGPPGRSRWPARPTARRSRSPTTSGRGAGGQRRGRERPGRGRRGVRPRRPPGPGPDAPAQAGLPAGHAAGVAPRDPAPRGGRAAGPRRRRRRARARASTRSAATGQTGPIGSVNAGPGGARQGARRTSAKVTGRAIDLVADDPGRRKTLLTEALPAARAAEQAKRQRGRRRPAPGAGGRPAWTALYGVVPVASTTLFTFKPAAGAAPIDLGALVHGPGRRAVRARPLDQDRLPHRPQAQEGDAGRPRRPARPAARKVGDAEVPRRRRPRRAHPRHEERPVALAPVERDGQGHARSRSRSTAQLVGRRRDGHRDVTCRTPSRGLYNLYVVDPSEQQILAYSPAADGGGFPAKPDRLAGRPAGRQRR